MPPPPVPTAASDREWQRLRRTSRDEIAAILAAPQNVAAERLLRSTTFNPRDSYVDPSQRSAVAAVIDRERPAIDAAVAEVRRVRAAEFDRLRAAGRTTVVRFGEIETARRLRRIGSDVVFAVIDGETHAVGLGAIPDTQRADASLRRLADGLCRDLISVFAAVGTMEPAERVALLERTTLR